MVLLINTPRLVLCSALLLLNVVAGLTVNNAISFDDYLKEYGKSYNDQEYEIRKSIYEARVEEIVRHNSGSHSYFLGINHMSDWTDDEIDKISSSRVRMKKKSEKVHLSSSQQLPHEVDYRTRNPPVLTAIKNQGYCGSCWAHSAVEAIESHWAIATGNLHVLSQQQLTSCTPNPKHCGGTGGCSGSVESLAFDYAAEAGGVVEEWAYPYTSFFGETGECKSIMGAEIIAKVSGYVSVENDNQNALMDAVAFKGPIAVSVAANGWHSYAGGIFDGCDYAKNITQNHAVQLVGYGHDIASGKDYWIIRNSWGPRWGENGYMRLLKTDTPECGWNVDAHSGSACDGDPDVEWVCGMCGILTGATYPIVDPK